MLAFCLPISTTKAKERVAKAYMAAGAVSLNVERSATADKAAVLKPLPNMLPVVTSVTNRS